MRRVPVPVIVLLVVVTVSALAGCGWMARRIAAEMALTRVERRFAVMSGKVASFRSCLTASGGLCNDAQPTGLAAHDDFRRQALTTDLRALRAAAPAGLGEPAAPSAAERAMIHPVQTRLNALYNSLAALPAAPATGFAVASQPQGGELIELRFSPNEVDEYLQLVAEATEGDDWQTLASAAEMQGIRSWEGNLARYVAAYVRDYFQGGKFLKVDVGGSGITDALRKRFPLLTDAQLRDVFKDYLGSGWLFGGVAAESFVTRAGAEYRFPAVDLRVDPVGGAVSRASELDLPLVASDLTRVVLEAVFDAHDRLPAVSGASGVSIPDAGLPVHDPAVGSVDAAEFGAVNRIANQAEAAVSSAVGPAIRGAGWASLNNESLARLIETLVAVTVRKVTEKAAWCWYSCRLNDAVPSAGPAGRVEVLLVIQPDA